MAHTLPLSETIVPEDQAALAAEIRAAYEARRAVYPVGGGTALDYGLAAKVSGVGLSTARLTRVVDYPARDMTVTVESGITMADLNALLLPERQRLPIDVPRPDRATLGGVIATNWSGPRRYGQGTVRDYVIGISAVDGRGVPFKAGGRVVKNVAGYDFCKLLTGSLGTLAVITQVTLKLKPRPPAAAWLTCAVGDATQAERVLSALIHSQTTPAAIELLRGAAWQSQETPAASRAAGYARIAVGLEGTEPEVAWMLERLALEWRELGLSSQAVTAADDICAAYQEITAFPSADDVALAVRINVPPGKVVDVLGRLDAIRLPCSVQCHAGNGILNVLWAAGAELDITHVILKELQPLAATCHGNVVVLRSPGQDLTRQLTWGVGRDDRALMLEVKRQFDPAGILNPGRFVV